MADFYVSDIPAFDAPNEDSFAADPGVCYQRNEFWPRMPRGDFPYCIDRLPEPVSPFERNSIDYCFFRTQQFAQCFVRTKNVAW